mmetsp:Transcript_728/g.2192  ORF Transcript_728/g.2192 Transcript_728/m.2192 type:complete len:126 (-) Transcript_728:114-491(-)
MFQKLPRCALDEAGSAGMCDFCHAPAEYTTGTSLGYGFVNFRTCESAQACLQTMDGSERLCMKRHSKPLVASWAQGFEAMCKQARRQFRARKSNFCPYIGEHMCECCVLNSCSRECYCTFNMRSA